jgi:hypothetical protein
MCFGEPLQKAGGQFFGPGIDSDDHRSADSANLGEQSVDEMHGARLLPYPTAPGLTELG